MRSTPTSGIPRIPRQSQASYKAAQLLLSGPMTERDLFAAVDFGQKPSLRNEALTRAIDTGWLVHNGDLIDLTDFAREHFADAPKAKYVGKVAEPRSVNVMHRPAYVPKKRLPRDDEPDWSLRSGTTFFTVA
jgi:hypothetical protein